jgi:hypothetical protein
MSDTEQEPQQQDPAQETREQLRQKYLDTIQRLWVHRPDVCPICGSDWWSMAELVEVPIRETDQGSLHVFPGSRQAYVYVPIGCLICGYTIFFHSGTLDVRAEEEVKTVPPRYSPSSKYGKGETK